jgi:anti-anti-sigma factor
MQFRLEEWRRWDILTVEGALLMTRLSHTPPIFDVLGGKTHPMVALDLSRAEAMDSGALSILVSLKKQVQRNGGQLVVVAPSEEIRVLFGIVGFDDHLRVFDSRSEFETYVNKQHS